MSCIIVCGQNYMTRQDMRQECANKWMPILVMKRNDQILIPVFASSNTAMRFAKRNLPKDWLCGHAEITEDLRKLFDMKGLLCEQLAIPRKLKDIVEFDIEILEYEFIDIT